MNSGIACGASATHPTHCPLFPFGVALQSFINLNLKVQSVHAGLFAVSIAADAHNNLIFFPE